MGSLSGWGGLGEVHAFRDGGRVGEDGESCRSLDVGMVGRRWIACPSFRLSMFR